MNLDKDPESWARVSPEAVMTGSDGQVRNVLTMALKDIARMAAEIARLKGIIGVARVAIDELPTQTITDAEIKRVALAKISLT